jgi:hypothetical protein
MDKDPLQDKEPFRLVVLGDSLSFTDERGPQLPTEPTLFPNVLARLLEDALLRPVSATVLARAGSDVREAWRMVFKDRHAQFDVLAGADAVVVAVGSFDNGPAGYPIALDALVPYLHPASVRRRFRATLRAIHPWVIRLTAGRYPRTTAKEFARLFDAVLLQVRGLAHGAAGVVLGPTSHTSSHYGGIHPQREARERLLLGIASQHGFPGVAAWRLIEPHADALNPDGIHWPAPAHAGIARALAEQLLAQIRGDAPRPPSPWQPAAPSEG